VKTATFNFDHMAGKNMEWKEERKITGTNQFDAFEVQCEKMRFFLVI